MQDTDYFVQVHSKVGEGHEKNYSQVKLIYYPPIPSIGLHALPEHRFQEHVDYGTFTLLFADKKGGLEVVHVMSSTSLCPLFSQRQWANRS